MTRTRECPECGRRFSYEISQGTDRKYCMASCREVAHKSLAKVRIASLPQCSAPECENKATRTGAGLCETHYYRLRRTGTLEKKPPKYRYQPVGRYGYITLYLPKHPLCNGRGNVDEHRKILYDNLGPGPHECYWRGITITWGEAVADHLNEQKADNRKENLVLTCNECNRSRGAALRFLHRVRPERFEQYVKLAREYYACQPHDRPTDKGSRYIVATGHNQKTAKTRGWGRKTE